MDKSRRFKLQMRASKSVCRAGKVPSGRFSKNLAASDQKRSFEFPDLGEDRDRVVAQRRDSLGLARISGLLVPENGLYCCSSLMVDGTVHLPSRRVHFRQSCLAASARFKARGSARTPGSFGCTRGRRRPECSPEQRRQLAPTMKPSWLRRWPEQPPAARDEQLVAREHGHERGKILRHWPLVLGWDFQSRARATHTFQLCRRSSVGSSPGRECGRFRPCAP